MSVPWLENRGRSPNWFRQVIRGQRSFCPLSRSPSARNSSSF